jgi:hypothetical protein
MADLTQAKRDKLPKKDFGLPKTESYPMPDRKHAALAETYATIEENKGKLSHTDAMRIRAKARQKLGE